MNGKVFVGQKALSLTEYEKTDPITGVILWVDDENCYEAGDKTGTVIEQDCPYATQQMANNLLATLQGYSYQGLEANGAKVSPIAELGDGITVGGIYTQLAYQNIRFSSGEVMDIAAPGSNETLHEYKAEGQTTKKFTRQIAETRSLISKTSEEILLQVDNLGDQVSTISTKLDSITLTVQNGSTSSTIKLMAGSAEISSQTIQMNGLVTFTGLQNGTTTIDGACIKTGTIDADRIDTDSLYVNAANITGSLTIGQLPSSVATTSDIPQYTSELVNNSGYQTASGVTSIINGTVTTDYVNALGVSARYLQGQSVYLLNSSDRTVGELTMTGASTASYAVDLYSYGALRLTAGSGAAYIEAGSSFIEIDSRISCGNDIAPSYSGGYSCGISSRRWSDIYADNSEIQTSDQNKKHDIEELPEKYLEMMDRIRPVRYRLNDGTSGRFHVGFIAQEVEQAMADAKIGSLEFGGWVKDIDEDGNDIYMLRYSEFIAVLWAKIRQLESRLEATA